MKKLLEITRPSQCLHRKPSFVSYHPLTKERDGHAHIEGYCCEHPKCTKEFLDKLNKDFLPCNNDKKFPARCLLNEPIAETPLITMSDEVAEKIGKIMDIYSKRGAAVRLQMKDGEVFGGYDGDKKYAL